MSISIDVSLSKRNIDYQKLHVASIAWSWKIEIKWILSTGQEIHRISNWNSLNVEHQAGVIVINVALVALYSGRQLAWLNVGFALHIFPMRKLAAMQRVLGQSPQLAENPTKGLASSWLACMRVRWFRWTALSSWLGRHEASPATPLYCRGVGSSQRQADKQYR